MAENEDGTEKTEQPSEKREREAREKGQRPRSRELGNAAVLGAATALIWTLGPGIAAQAKQWMRLAMSVEPELLQHPGDIPRHALAVAATPFSIVIPLLSGLLLTGIVAAVALGGFGFSVNALTPKWERLDPMAGIRRLWGRDAMMQFLASMLRVAIVAGVAATLMNQVAPQLLSLIDMPLEQAAASGVGIALRALMAMTVGFVLIAAIDVPYQMWSHRNRLMMTREEVRQEHKDAEGRPEVKAKLRRMQQEMSRGRMLESVPTADVIVVNPTHYAVALKYESGSMRSPRVVAKGVDEIAAVIRQIAEQHRVPVLSAPPLARALYRQVQIGSEIPVTLYAAVAQVLSYVYQLRAYRREGGDRPVPPDLR
jgi:flagellar biosynthesis protein FlhB